MKRNNLPPYLQRDNPQVPLNTRAQVILCDPLLSHPMTYITVFVRMSACTVNNVHNVPMTTVHGEAGKRSTLLGLARPSAQGGLAIWSTGSLQAGRPVGHL